MRLRTFASSPETQSVWFHLLGKDLGVNRAFNMSEDCIVEVVLVR